MRTVPPNPIPPPTAQLRCRGRWTRRGGRARSPRRVRAPPRPWWPPCSVLCGSARGSRSAPRPQRWPPLVEMTPRSPPTECTRPERGQDEPGSQEHKAQGAAEPRLRHGIVLRSGASIRIIVAWLLPTGSRALGSLRGLRLPRLRRLRNLRLLRLPRLRLLWSRRLFIGTFALDRTDGDRLILALGRKRVP